MSAAAKHTPGPWSVPHFAQPDVNCECKWVLCDHLMGAVAAVYVSGEGEDWSAHGDNPRFDEAKANARLIAAAPDLLEALAWVRKNYAAGSTKEINERIDAAIAKATQP